MALYQVSVLNKYLNLLDQNKVDKAYKKYIRYFHNTTIQENIKNSKEEQYQAKFLDELFVNILGYVFNPKPKFNLTTEYKNEKGAGKADGAILKDNSAIAVIELKGTKTKDLESIRKQAFDYKANQKKCVYVITSNYEKLRFYINDATEFLEFNLFNLSEEDFKLMYLCLQKDSIFKNIPLKVKEDSVAEEDKITKDFYKDYSLFKRELYRDLVKQNAKELKVLRHSELVSESHKSNEVLQNDLQRLEKNVKLTLFKKSQKLIDRFLFIFFAEDRGLLSPNSTINILKDWNKLKDLDAEVPLYNRFKQYFNYLDQGRKGTDKKAEIYAYNGGLFKPDTILDAVKIDDELLYKHASKLANYDFQSQVDVNILGHIFENSLNEIESVNAEIEGGEFDKQKSKRKKDGVFYTPKYITKYIVDNTLGKLCEEKKEALKITEERFVNAKKRSQKGIKDLEAYRSWLLDLTICDPACGSGAFLNQALEFLIAEHNYLDELQASYHGGFQFPDIENTILENNIYGVDLNEESVEIAKLSLWLRTAQPRRKLNDLSSNIKCGNSLIDSKTVVGDKAFKWEEEFPKVFEKGGFDVIIGNPPYVKRQNLSDENQILFLEKKYQSATYNFDLYLLFIEKASKLINSKGLVSYINPSKFTSTKTGEGLRSFIDNNCNILRYIDFKEFQVFEDVTTYCCIFFLNNDKKGKTEYLELNEQTPIDIDTFKKYEIVIKENASGLGWQFKPAIDIKGKYYLRDYVQTITGIESGADNLYILEKNNPVISSIIQYEGEIVYPIIKGTNVNRYYFEEKPFYGIIPYLKDKSLISAEVFKKNFDSVWSYLKENQDVLEEREKGKMRNEGWYGFVYPKNLYKYSNDRLIWTDISIKPQFVIDKTKSWHVRTVCSLELNKNGIKKGLTLNLLLAILNSNLFFYFIKNNSNSVRGGYFRYKPQYVKEFPIPDFLCIESIMSINKNVQVVSDLTKEHVKTVNNFQAYVKSQFSIEKLSKKLQNWHELEFLEFIKELNKAIKKSGGNSLDDKAQFSLMSLFDEQQGQAQNIKFQIDKIDKEIDAMVYELYGLTDEEIAIVENS